MKNFQISVLTRDFIHCLNFAGGIIEKRSVKPILGNVRLDVGETGLTITGTSSDMSIKMSIKGRSSADGSTTVNVITLLDIVRKISDEEITLVFDEPSEQLTINGSNFTSNLPTLPSHEFPQLDNDISSVNSLKISAKKLLRLITCSEFAMSTEETRYNLNGIYLNSSSDKILNSTAIDGHRLSTISEDIDNSIEFGLIIPRKAVFELIKILKDASYTDLDAIITFDLRRICLVIGNIQMTSKLVDASFPEYKTLIPIADKNKLSIHAKYLMEVVDRVSSITHDKFRAIKFNISSNVIEISAFGETKGSARELIQNTENDQKFSYEGENITIGFNPKYLLDILKNLDDNEVELFFSESLNPILVKSLIYDNDKYIIMPMKV